MNKKLVLAILVGAMTMTGAGAAGAAPADKEDQFKSTEGYVAPIEEDIVSAQDWVYTRGYVKSYQNLYNMTVAEHHTRTQWNANDAKTVNTEAGELWQENWTAVAYSFNNEVDDWNYFYSNVGEAKQSVKFESGIPTPWGNVGGSSFTSTIVTKVKPDGTTTAS